MHPRILSGAIKCPSDPLEDFIREDKVRFDTGFLFIFKAQPSLSASVFVA